MDMYLMLNEPENPECGTEYHNHFGDVKTIPIFERHLKHPLPRIQYYFALPQLLYLGSFLDFDRTQLHWLQETTSTHPHEIWHEPAEVGYENIPR